MILKENCPNKLIFGFGTVASSKEGFDHMTNGFNEQLMNNLCPKCEFDKECKYKQELLQNIKFANKKSG